MAKVDWDQNEDKASAGFEVIPKGRYPCMIDSSEEKATKGGDGQFFEFAFSIMKGEFKGRKLWSRLNIKNPSEMAQQIGREQFKALCVAAGKETVKKTEELHGKYVVCLVDIERGKDGYRDQNRISGYMSAESFRAEASSAKPAAATAGNKTPAKVGGGEDPDDDIPF